MAYTGRQMSNYPLVRVVWLDAHGSAVSSYSIDEIPHAAIKVETYGLLLKQDEVGISIASEICDNDVYRGYSFVPAGMLVSVTPVTKQRKPRAKKLTTILVAESPVAKE